MTPTLARVDLRWNDGGPTLDVWTHDGQRHTYPLTPREAFAIVRRLIGYLGNLNADWTDNPQEDPHV
jgi:hypothetical protein